MLTPSVKCIRCQGLGYREERAIGRMFEVTCGTCQGQGAFDQDGFREACTLDGMLELETQLEEIHP